jgi:hypothetical protein
MSEHPFHDFAVAFTAGQLLAQRFRIDTRELEELLIRGAGVPVFAGRAGNDSAAFVEHPGQDHEAAQANPRAPGWVFGQVRE